MLSWSSRIGWTSFLLLLLKKKKKEEEEEESEEKGKANEISHFRNYMYTYS